MLQRLADAGLVSGKTINPRDRDKCGIDFNRAPRYCSAHGDGQTKAAREASVDVVATEDLPRSAAHPFYTRQRAPAPTVRCSRMHGVLMQLDDELVAIYFGEDTDSLFVKTLLEGSGIPASLRNFSMSGGGVGRTDVRVFVARRDVERAQPLVDHFKKHGQKSPG
jgi:hypothetical protein